MIYLANSKEFSNMVKFLWLLLALTITLKMVHHVDALKLNKVPCDFVSGTIDSLRGDAIKSIADILEEMFGSFENDDNKARKVKAETNARKRMTKCIDDAAKTVETDCKKGKIPIIDESNDCVKKVYDFFEF